MVLIPWFMQAVQHMKGYSHILKQDTILIVVHISYHPSEQFYKDRYGI